MSEAAQKDDFVIPQGALNVLKMQTPVYEDRFDRRGEYATLKKVGKNAD